MSDYRGLIEEMEQDKKEKQTTKIKSPVAVWITDRRPTKDDADCRGHVWSILNEEDPNAYLVEWESVGIEAPWQPTNRPDPYQPPAPPEPDTSLAASISRIEVAVDDGLGRNQRDCATDVRVSCDLDRIIDAARRWDDSMQETTELADAVANDPDGVGEAARKFDFHSDAREDLLFLINDPDGVGDGWRLLRDGEVIQPGDQFKMNDRWYLIHDPGKTHGGTAIRRRRRIEVER